MHADNIILADTVYVNRRLSYYAFFRTPLSFFIFRMVDSKFCKEDIKSCSTNIECTRQSPAQNWAFYILSKRSIVLCALVPPEVIL